MRVKIDNLGSIGVIKDRPEQELPPEAWTDASNVRFTTQGVASFPGDRRVMASAITTPKWLMQIPPAERPYWIYGDESKLCAFDGSSHFDVTRAGQPYSGNSTQRWNSALISGLLVMNNTFDIPQVWTAFQPTTPMIDLPNWPTNLRCRFLRTFKVFLIAGYMTEDGQDYPYRLRWSHPAQPGAVPLSWTTNDPRYDSRQVDLGETEDVLVDSVPMGDINIIYRERNVWGMQYIGGQSVFRLWNIIEEQGALWRDCIQTWPGGHLVLGQDDIYVHNGTKNSSQSVIHDKLRKWLFSIISPENFYNSFTVKNSQEKEIWICVPEAGGTYPTLALTWNWKSGSIGFRDLDEIPFAAAGTIASNDNQEGSWGE